MRLNKVAFVFALGLCFAAQAEDDVFVDLSVLDSLNGAYIAPHEPLFPVLPKKEKVVKPKAKTSVKKTASKKRRSAPVVEVKEEKIPEIKVLPIEKTEEAEVVVVDVEPVAPEVSEVVAEVKPAADMPSLQTEQPVENEPAVEEELKKSVENEPAVEEELDRPVESEPAAEETAADVSGINELQLLQPAEAVNPEEKKPELLIDENLVSEPVEAASGNSIIFADGEDELTPEQMAKIDDIIGRFKDVTANKIAIYSYNLDDGVDSFRKKRVSLNRAVGIRGYLIKQGYKNFSIKVININSDSDKINTVELEEL